jgi:branched-chain amino acid aminotransferase
MNNRIIYHNGEFVDEKEARISVYDSALMFGDMVFEMTRSFNQKTFKLREHIDRLMAGIKIYRIPFDYSADDVEMVCEELIKKNKKAFLPTDEHRLMINVSRGPLAIYSEVFNNKITPTFIVTDFPLKWTVQGMGKLYDTGINAVISSQRAIPFDLLDPKIKSRSRVHYQMANIEVSQVKGDNNWALLLETNGFITEGTGDNFFIFKGGRLFTPRHHNILCGISRDQIFEFEYVNEVNITPYDVYTADEAFMTGTPFCILPVTSLNGIKIGTGKVGEVTRNLIMRWSELVGVDIVGQIKGFNRETKGKSGTTPYKF